MITTALAITKACVEVTTIRTISVQAYLHIKERVLDLGQMADIPALRAGHIKLTTSTQRIIQPITIIHLFDANIRLLAKFHINSMGIFI